MNETVIRVFDLGKQYRIGGVSEPYKTFRTALIGAARAPMRGFRALMQRSGIGQEQNFYWALKDVNFEVQRGEVVGLIGRNGAGKSTLLKILSRITEPTVGGADVHGRVGSLLEVGTGFHPELTGRENVYLNGAIIGMHRREIEKKFDEIVAFAEIEQFIDTAVKHYSSGMYLRLAFAVAAHLEPEILLVDEVLAVGDAAFQKKCLGKMSEVSKQGRTVLFVSHNMSAIEELCQRVILISSGKIEKDGATESVISRYLADAFVSEDGGFDLSNHSARSKKYQTIVQSIQLSSKGVRTSHFYPDDSMSVEIDLECPYKIKEPRLAIAIEDHLGRRLMTLGSYFSNELLVDIEGICKIRCTIPILSLGPGNYLISVSIGTRYGGLLDSLDNAAWFDVGWRNNYFNGEPYQSIYGPIIKESTWEKVSR